MKYSVVTPIELSNHYWREWIIKTYISLLSRWLKIIFGDSYYHVQQPLGKFISTDSIGGYYNDFTAKSDWQGKTDESAIPINILSNEVELYFPITITQYALGTYDRWLADKDDSLRSRFINIAEWLVSNQDRLGGYENPWAYLRPSTVSEYSSMAQGQAISVLVRAYLLTERDEFLESAHDAYNLMMKTVDEGGCALYIDDKIFLEEYPENPRSTVLNGWIYSVFGLYDLVLVTKDQEIKTLTDKSIWTIEQTLSEYDTGYWTLYDLHGTLASPFYHSLHITLLDALYFLTQRKTFADYKSKWQGYESNAFNRNKALLLKALQRLKNPAKVSIVK